MYDCGGRARSRGPVRKIVPDSVPGTDPRSGLDRPTFVRGTLRRSRAVGPAPSGDSGARWGCGAGVPQRESQEGSGGAGSAGRPDPGPGQQIQQERAAGDACIGALAPNLAAGSRTEHTAGGGGEGFSRPSPPHLRGVRRRRRRQLGRARQPAAQREAPAGSLSADRSLRGGGRAAEPKISDRNGGRRLQEHRGVQSVQPVTVLMTTPP